MAHYVMPLRNVVLFSFLLLAVAAWAATIHLAISSARAGIPESCRVQVSRDADTYGSNTPPTPPADPILTNRSAPTVSFSRQLDRYVANDLFHAEGLSTEENSMTQKWQIERYIHQTWKSSGLDRQQTGWSDSWKKQNPDHKYHLWTDAEINEYVDAEWPLFAPVFHALPRNILKADLFRYMVVYSHGGVYSDLDTTCQAPIRDWMIQMASLTRVYSPEEDHGEEGSLHWSRGSLAGGPVRCVVGLENDWVHENADFGKRYPDWTRANQLTQWTFACSAGHPLMGHVLRSVLSELRSKRPVEQNRLDIMELTGPAVWTDAVREYLFLASNLTRFERLGDLHHPLQVGDVLILPLRGFGWSTWVKNGPKEAGPWLVKHWFRGSWK
jgi:alpha 1,6-mannosyltransferase